MQAAGCLMIILGLLFFWPLALVGGLLMIAGALE